MTDLLFNQYDQFLKGMYSPFNKSLITGKDREAAELAHQLIAQAKILDIQRAHDVLAKPINGIARSIDIPPRYTNENVIGQIWADDEDFPLKPGEVWNYGNRGTASGVTFSFDADSKPICPYFNFGLNGRGMIGRFGPNHAVDMAPYQILDNGRGGQSLFVRGIIRQDSGLPALCGGFTNFEKAPNGSYPYTLQTMVTTQANEFFEEMISGSVELMPYYTKDLDQEIIEEIEKRETLLKKPLSTGLISRIANEITTHRKVLQVEHEDPQFLHNLRLAFLSAHECYSGPVISSIRNTNSAWMETRLSCFELDDKTWKAIKGKNEFNYEFKAGDDASHVLMHELTPGLIQNAESHGALFCYSMASALLTSKHKDRAVANAIKSQAEHLITALSSGSLRYPAPRA
jgi:hypothetical protein